MRFLEVGCGGVLSVVIQGMGLGFRVYGLGFKSLGFGFKIWG